jgi:hypothetical protein
MHFGELDIPDAISAALKARNLVIFVGAGVSKPKPSDLPMFDALADRIAAGTGMSRQVREIMASNGNDKTTEMEPIDRFLGRLAKSGVKVKQLARDVLVGEHTRPNSLHENLVRVFRDVADVRIVTTNFDQHLSTILNEVHKDHSAVYSAPALPVGSDFSGLVYLHGSAVKDAERCVLTDEDFGRAYLTEGWARRFLVAMFARFTVLFVGYSHNDPVMNYLARGLPPDSRHRRFAFVPRGEEAHWHFLDIQPVLYPRVEGENRHQALADGLEKWALRCQQSFLDNVRRLNQYATSSPPWGDPEEQDFVEACFKDAELLPHFVSACRNAEWLDWIQERGLLRPLFTPETNLSKCDELLAWWLARHLLGTNTPKLLLMVQMLGANSVHAAFCDQIHFTLAHLKHEAGVSAVFSKWIVVLLAQPRDRLSPQSWASLLAACTEESTLSLVGLLFERATELSIRINKSWLPTTDRTSEDDAVIFEVEIEHEVAYSLHEAWKPVLEPNLSRLAPILEPIVTQRIAQANGVHRAVNREGSAYDPLSYSRNSIEPNHQNGHADAFDYFIDLARDIVTFYQSHSPHHAETIIRKWLELDVTLLKRLAIHALARQASMTEAQRIQTCIDRGWLFDRAVRTEVFFLLSQLYSRLRSEERELLFLAIEAGPDKEQSSGLDDEDKQRMVFRLIGWIAREARSCPIAQSRFAAQQMAHADWRLSEHPDLRRWSTDFQFVAPGTGVDLEATLKKPAVGFIQTLTAAPSSGHFDERRDSFCSAIPPLMSKSVEWAIDCQRAACEMRIPDDDVWLHVCMGWREVKPTKEQWPEIFAQISNVETPIRFFHHLPDTLEAWAKRKEDVVPDSLLSTMDNLAITCWRKALQNDPPIDESSRDWLNEAVNHAGGSHAEYLLLRLEAIRKSQDHKIEGIPEPIREALVAIIHSDSGSGELGRVIVAAQVRWLYAVDPNFTNEEVIPLFNWSVDHKRAEQCWHGFLGWGHWSAPLVDRLLPSFAETVRRLASQEEQDSERIGKRIAEHLAWLCIWLVDDPMANDWLLSSIRAMAVENRRDFAREIKKQLATLSSEEIEKRWDGWLSKYWSVRASGVPPLDPAEATYMFNWAVYPHKHTSDAVALALSISAIAVFSHTAFIRELRKFKMVESQPAEAAKLLLAFLERSPKWFHIGEDPKKLWQSLVAANVTKSVLEDIRGHLIRLGGNMDDFSQKGG